MADAFKGKPAYKQNLKPSSEKARPHTRRAKEQQQRLDELEGEIQRAKPVTQHKVLLFQAHYIEILTEDPRTRQQIREMLDSSEFKATRAVRGDKVAQAIYQKLADVCEPDDRWEESKDFVETRLSAT